MEGSTNLGYLMENSEEDLRLEVKTDPEVVKRQAAWAGIGPGMRVLDVGCGSGITTNALAELVGECGHVTGLDNSEKRLEIARQRYGSDRVSFVRHDISTPFYDRQPFDAVWARFILEYFRAEQREIVANSIASLRAGGIACLADSDNNSLGHCGQNERLQNTLVDIMARLESNFNFDPYAGRRLYGHLFSLGFTQIVCRVEPHHLIYGELTDKEAYNWLRKVELTAQKSGCVFSAYDGDYEAFRDEVLAFMRDPMRFTYTPLVITRGVKPG
jgi:ubiquinone/menaquinone biosynthesis C-methylase UbiE